MDDPYTAVYKSGMAKKQLMPVVGKTNEDLFVVSGVYSFYETHGVPFDVLFGGLQARGLIPSWLHLYRDARKAGIAHDRLLGQLDPAIVDSYGPKFRDEILKVLGTLADFTLPQLSRLCRP
jgi:hypothetical protein